jgi:hypothetical protein
MFYKAGRISELAQTLEGLMKPLGHVAHISCTEVSH